MAAVRTATRRGCGARGMAEAVELDVGRRAMQGCPPLSAWQLECGHGRSLGVVGGAHGFNGTGASMAPNTEWDCVGRHWSALSLAHHAQSNRVAAKGARLLYGRNA